MQPSTETVNTLLSHSPFSLIREDKVRAFDQEMRDLTIHHFENCEPYRNLLNALRFDPVRPTPARELPFLPVRLFKERSLASVPQDAIVRTMTSSGTSGQAVSRIHLDRETAMLQSRVLARIVGNFVGPKRLPLLIIDSPGVLRDRASFSARGAGIVGFSALGRDVTFALDDEMKIDWAVLDAFSERHAEEPILMFGFTFMVWEYFRPDPARVRRTFPNAVLFHGGGWKKLADRAVGAEEFREGLRDRWHIERAHNYYGLIEQAGSIHVECEHGYLHASNFSDVIIRNTRLEPCEPGRRGLVQLLSLLPRSYPGHNVLTEDEGTLVGEDDCPCGRRGRYFLVHGRAAEAEARGCSDTHVRA